MTTHTPGPWTYAYGAVYQGAPKDCDYSNRLLLADRNAPGTSPCERDRNAQLAAAAPDLLAAARAYMDHQYNPGAVAPFLAHAFAAAIRKATGET